MTTRLVTCIFGCVDVCKYTSMNPCGQTKENPKIIPSLPFFYYDDSSKYMNIYDTDFDDCHSSGPDVVFQYTPSIDMVHFNHSNEI